MTMTACEILTRVDEILDSPERWTKGDYGKDIHGRTTSSPRAAVSTCIVGTLRKVQSDHYEEVHCAEYQECFSALNRIVKERTGAVGLPTYNDRPETTFEDIKSLIAESKKAVCR